MAQVKKRSCCVSSCTSTHETCSSFFRFPNDTRDRKRWKSAIGFPPDFEPNNNTFVCIRHFMERDIAQKADRKTGQKARLRILSTPRLFLEKIKEEKIEVEDAGNKEPKEQLAKSNTECSIESTKQTEQEIPAPKEMELTMDAFLKELRERNSQNCNGKRKRAKLSLVLPMLETTDIYSSDSDCDYQISLCVKKVSRTDHKKFKCDEIEAVSNSQNTITSLPYERTPEKAPPSPIKVESSQQTVLAPPPQIFEDDVEDAVTPTVIPRPKCLTMTQSSPNMHPKKRNYKPEQNDSPERNATTSMRNTNLILPPKKNYSNIMVASINDDGVIVEEMEELVTTQERSVISDIQVTASQEDLSQLIEVDFSGTIEEPAPVTNNLPPDELLQDTIDTTGQDTDDETNDGIVRTCYECIECKEMFLSRKKTIRHLKQSHGLTIGTTAGLKEHTKQYTYKNFRMVNGLRAFTCSVCLMLYYNVQSLKKHQTLMHAHLLGLENAMTEQNPPPPNSNVHVCHVCQKSFLEAENLRSHLLLHVNGKSDEVTVYKCEECGLGFEYEAALTRHTIEHHQTLKLYTCKYCMDAFATGADLIEHIQNHLMKNDQTLETGTDDSTKLSELVLQCPEDNCDMQFKDSKDYYSHILYTHRKVYQDDPKFIEYIQMVDPDTLNEKRTKTSGNQPKFNCRICDRKFTHYSFLKAHEEGKNKFKYECSECSEKTASKVCLVRHYNVIHDKNIERLHFCTDCPKSFPKKAELLSHIALHRQDSQSVIHHCTLDGCDRIFADQTTYHFHLSRLHPTAKNVGALVCKYENCNARFRHENLLKQHVSDAHLNKSSMTNVVDSYSGGETNSSSKNEQNNIFFGHSDKYVNGSMDLNIPDSLMPEVLNDVCNEVTIYTDF